MASTEDSVYDSVKSVLYGPSLTDWGGDKPSKNNETGTTSDVRSQITVGSRRLEKTLESTRRRIAPENNQNLMRGRSSPSTQEVTAWTVEVLQEIDDAELHVYLGNTARSTQPWWSRYTYEFIPQRS